jgi:hypothetical protein
VNFKIFFENLVPWKTVVIFFAVIKSFNQNKEEKKNIFVKKIEKQEKNIWISSSTKHRHKQVCFESKVEINLKIMLLKKRILKMKNSFNLKFEN